MYVIRMIEFRKGPRVDPVIMIGTCLQIMGKILITCLRNATVTSVHSLPAPRLIDAVIQDRIAIVVFKAQ